MGAIVPIHATLLDGGELNTRPPHEIAAVEAASAVNLDPRRYDGAVTRPGRTAFAGTNGSGVGTKGIKFWQRNAGSTYLIYRTGSTVWEASVGGIASTFNGGTAGARFNAVPLNNILVFAVDGLAPQQWDGTTWSGLTGSPPALAKYAALYSSKVFLAGDPNNPQTLSFCATNNPTNWTLANDAGSITSQAGGGDTIQGLRACRRWLCMFYRYYTEILIGSSVFDYQVERLKDVGLVSQSGHIAVGDVAFFASDYAVWMVAGSRVSDITSLKVRLWYQSIADKSKITLVLKGPLLLVIDYGSGTAYACDFNRQIWSCWTDQFWEAADLANDQTLYAGPSASTEQLYKLDSGTDDNGTPISAYWRTGNHSYNWPDSKKNDAGIHVLAKPGMSTITLTYFKNGVALASTKTLTFAAVGDAAWSKAGAQNSARGNYLAYKFAWTGPGTLYGFASYAEVATDQGEVPNEI